MNENSQTIKATRLYDDIWSPKAKSFCEHYHDGKSEPLSEQVQNNSRHVLCSRSLKYHFLETASKNWNEDGAFIITLYTKKEK